MYRTITFYTDREQLVVHTANPKQQYHPAFPVTVKGGFRRKPLSLFLLDHAQGEVLDGLLVWFRASVVGLRWLSPNSYSNFPEFVIARLRASEQDLGFGIGWGGTRGGHQNPFIWSGKPGGELLPPELTLLDWDGITFWSLVTAWAPTTKAVDSEVQIFGRNKPRRSFELKFKNPPLVEVVEG